MQNELNYHNLQRSFLRYLRAVSGNYTRGIPKSLLAEAEESVALESYESPDDASVELVFLTDDETIAKPELELLQAAVEKGMKRDFRNSRIFPYRGQDLSEIRATFPNVQIFVALGIVPSKIRFSPESDGDSIQSPADLPNGTLCSISGCGFILTRGLKSVLTDVRVKREFWEHLKLAMERLS